jgi:hypothetical protein
VRFDLCVVDLGATEFLLAHQIGRGKTLSDVAELMMDLTFDVAGLVIVQKHGARRAGIGRGVIGRQFLHFQFDQVERPLGRLRVDRGHRRDRLAAIAYAAAGKRIFVHGDRKHTVSVGTIIAGNDRPDSLERARLGNIQPKDVAVTYGAPQNASDQGIGMVEIGIWGAPVTSNAINQRTAAGNSHCTRISSVKLPRGYLATR